MNQDELEGCFKLLRAYWPGEWDEARYMVWAEAFQDFSFDQTRSALVTLGRESKWAAVSEFLRIAHAAVAEEKRREKGTFLPGTGWVKYMDSIAAARPDKDAVVVNIAELRRALEATRPEPKASEA